MVGDNMTVDILKDELTREAAAGFPLLRRTPCTGTVALIDYFEDLDGAGRVALLDGLAEVGVGRMRMYTVENAAVAAFHAARQTPRYAGGYRYTSVKLIAMMRRDPQSWAMFQGANGRAASVELIPDIEAMVPAKAPLLKKLCKGLDVSIDFGSTLGQLRYEFGGLAYEALWGAYLGWDVLTEENAERSIGVLREHLERLRGLLG